MSNLYAYAAKRAESSILMERLNLSEDFALFKANQEARHQETLKKFNKTKLGAMISAMVGTLGIAGCMIGGVLATPVLAAGLTACYAVGAIGVGAKLGEMFAKEKHNKEYGNSDIFLKEMDKQNHSMGEEFYKEFVERMDGKPALSQSLSEVSKKFAKKKAELENENNLSNELKSGVENTSENCGLKREKENHRRRKLGK